MDRWQITYTCSSISTVLPGQPIMAGQTMSGAASTMGAMMPSAMGPIMMMMSGAMMPAAMRPMMQTPAAGSTTATPADEPSSAAPTTMRPASSSAMTATTAGMEQRPASSPAMTATTAGMEQRPASSPAMTATTAGMGPGAPPMPGAMPTMGSPPPSGQINPRPLYGIAFNPQPSLRLIFPQGSENYVADATNNIVQSPVIPEANEELRILDTQESEYYVTQPAIEDHHQQLLIDRVTEPITLTENQEILRNLKRRKRNYDIFDLFHQSNRCERAYRICVTRSKNYIVSRFKNSKSNDHKIKNSDCLNKPARIVYGSEEIACPPLLNIDNKAVEVTVLPELFSPVAQNNDSLSAIIVHDESVEGSDFYSQNSPYTIPIPIMSYSRPEIFPMRTPPLIALQTKEQENRSFNNSSTVEKGKNLHEFYTQELSTSVN